MAKLESSTSQLWGTTSRSTAVARHTRGSACVAVLTRPPACLHHRLHLRRPHRRRHLRLHHHHRHHLHLPRRPLPRRRRHRRRRRPHRHHHPHPRPHLPRLPRRRHPLHLRHRRRRRHRHRRRQSHSSRLQLSGALSSDGLLTRHLASVAARTRAWVVACIMQLGPRRKRAAASTVLAFVRGRSSR